MNPPLVSIIIPNRDYGRYLREAVDSALGQTYESVEVIVVDDGSVDESRSIIRSYGGKVQAVLQANLGAPGARNAGIARTSGEFLVFLDADDSLLPDAVESLLQGFRDFPDSGIVFGDTLTGRPGEPASAIPAGSGRVFSRDEFLFHNPILMPTAMVHRRVIEKIGGFNASFLQADDYDLWIRGAAVFPVRHVERAVARVRWHEGSLSGDRVRQLTWETRVLASHLDGSSHARKALGRAFHRLAYECRLAGLITQFARATLRGLRYRPGYWKNWLYLAYIPLSVFASRRRQVGRSRVAK